MSTFQKINYTICSVSGAVLAFAALILIGVALGHIPTDDHSTASDFVRFLMNHPPLSIGIGSIFVISFVISFLKEKK